jgi:hypothetical protein
LFEGLAGGPIPFEDFVETKFAEGAQGMTPWKYEAGDHKAQ